VFLHPSRHADAPRLCQTLQTRSHVDPVSKDVFPVDDDVALVDAHPELDTLLLRHLGITFRHPTLNLDGTPKGVHHARKLHEHAVAGGLDESATVLGDLRVYEGAAVGLELSERPFLVSAHEAAVSGHVSGQDRCKPTLYAVGGGGQGGAPV